MKLQWIFFPKKSHGFHFSKQSNFNTWFQYIILSLISVGQYFINWTMFSCYNAEISLMCKRKNIKLLIFYGAVQSFPSSPSYLAFPHASGILCSPVHGEAIVFPTLLLSSRLGLGTEGWYCDHWYTEQSLFFNE